jgi:hypothetical protein
VTLADPPALLPSRSDYPNLGDEHAKTPQPHQSGLVAPSPSCSRSPDLGDERPGATNSWRVEVMDKRNGPPLSRGVLSVPIIQNTAGGGALLACRTQVLVDLVKGLDIGGEVLRLVVAIFHVLTLVKVRTVCVDRSVKGICTSHSSWSRTGWPAYTFRRSKSTIKWRYTSL